MLKKETNTGNSPLISVIMPCYNAARFVAESVACVFGQLARKPEALDAVKKAWEAGFKDRSWARRDPDLAILHDDPEFEKLYPPGEDSE